MRPLLFLLLLASCDSSTSNNCMPGKECIALRFCPSDEVESLDPEKFCGDPGFYRYCCTPEVRTFPEKPKENRPIHQKEVACFDDSDCPETELFSISNDLLREVEVYHCQESPSCDYDNLDEYIGGCTAEEKTCQPKTVPFCTHPEARKHPECEIRESDPIFTLTRDGHIECKIDSDCPPTALPSWEWNDVTKMEYGVKSITEMSIEVTLCSPSSGPSNVSLCDVRSEPFCGHEYGQSHPECQRCNVLTPVPNPPCLDFGISKRQVSLEQCCADLFKVKIKLATSIINREEILENFTINDCRLSALHLPQAAPPRTSFDPELICCSFPGYCPMLPSLFETSNGVPLSFLTAVTGIGSLGPKSLAAQNSQVSCPFGHCKRPSLARPGKLVCCLLIRAPWGKARIAICPNSCD